MSITKFNPGNIILLSIILLVALLRLASFSGIGPLTLFTPLGAMALFSGVYFPGKIRPFVFPLLTLFISDVIVSFYIFPEMRTGILYSGWFWVYLAFALITLSGKLIVKKVTLKNMILSILMATIIHWIVSDISMCVQANTFTMRLYMQKLVEAIPYELRFMAGTAFYCTVMFGVVELLHKKFPSLQFSIHAVK